MATTEKSHKVLVTGGAGYIGSHTVLVLLEAGLDVVVVDNLSNGHREALKRVQDLTRRSISFYEADIRDSGALNEIFNAHTIDGVIHFAGLKAVGESNAIPLSYYANNLVGSVNLLQCMSSAGVKRIVFSSSATVYGEEASVPYVESHGRGHTTSPYGTTKAMIEKVLEDLVASDPEWSVMSLRYFNPIGAHPSGLIGEDTQGPPNNLMPFISQVAIGRRKKLFIFGGGYPTPDGTCRRDYLHVMDLAEGHLAAVKLVCSGFDAINLGTGNPISVLEMVKEYEKINSVEIPFEIVSRRIGDLAEFWADASKAYKLLGWKARRSLKEMMEDSWRWQTKNPHGYCKETD